VNPEEVAKSPLFLNKTSVSLPGGDTVIVDILLKFSAVATIEFPLKFNLVILLPVPTIKFHQIYSNQLS